MTFPIRLPAVLLFLVSAFLAAACSQAAAAKAEFKALHVFKAGRDGDFPRGGLVADSDGNLYGTVLYGGSYTYGGTVFMLTPPPRGDTKWRYRVIHRFSTDLSEGNGPIGALTIRKGVLYGTTHGGGDPSCGCGTVFRLRPLDRAKTKWKYATIHRFRDPKTGTTPNAGVVFGPDGALYGATIGGGKKGAGVVFRLTGSGDKPWTKTIIHEFTGDNPNSGPEGELLLDAKGSEVYGTTYGNGKFGQGTVFRLKRAGHAWTHTVLHDFRGIYTSQPADGSQPRGILAWGKDGSLYGTTELGDRGGHWNGGTIYQLKPKAGGKWSYSVLHEFIGGDDDGHQPKSGLTRAPDGSFFGVTAGGGATGAGALYNLTGNAQGKWRVKVLYSFNSNRGDTPWSRPILRKGTLFGTVIQGANVPKCTTGCGAVYQFRP